MIAMSHIVLSFHFLFCFCFVLSQMRVEDFLERRISKKMKKVKNYPNYFSELSQATKNNLFSDKPRFSKARSHFVVCTSAKCVFRNHVVK